MNQSHWFIVMGFPSLVQCKNSDIIQSYISFMMNDDHQVAVQLPFLASRKMESFLSRITFLGPSGRNHFYESIHLNESLRLVHFN